MVNMIENNLSEEEKQALIARKTALVTQLEADGFNMSLQAISMLEQVVTSASDELLGEFIAWYKNRYENIGGGDVLAFIMKRGKATQKIKSEIINDGI